MRHFPLPIHAAVVAATVVAGLASYQGVDKLVLARGGSQYGTGSEPGHEPSSPTTTTLQTSTTSPASTTGHLEPTSSTSSTVPEGAGPITSTTLSTPTTEKHEPGSTPPTTTYKEPGPITSTTVKHEPTPSTTTPAPPTVEVLSLKCGTVVLTDGHGGASCAWSPSTAANFYKYVVTRELVGTPNQIVFTTQDRTHNHFGDTTLTAGSQYSYIVWAYDAAGNLIGRSGPLHVNCCDGTVVST